MGKKATVCLLMGLVLIVGGCAGRGRTDKGAPTTTATAGGAESISAEDMFTDRDRRAAYDVTKAVTVHLENQTAVCSDSSVTVEGSTVTVTQNGVYIFSGTLDGRIVVDADKNAKPQLVLNGVSVTSADSAALYIAACDKVFVTLADGTENTLANAGEFASDDGTGIDGAVFSKQDVTFNGGGNLTVLSPDGHGIVGKDDVVFAGGEYTISAAAHGVKANDSVRAENTVMTVTAGKDGVHADNDKDDTKGFVYISGGDFTIISDGDGISASAYAAIADGTFDITAGGGSTNSQKEHADSFDRFAGSGFDGQNPRWKLSTAASADSASMKGIKANGNIVIDGGTFAINAADDAVHSNASVTVNGGTFTVATGDDGFHADDTLTVAGGTVTVTESYEGLEALHVIVSGGTLTLVAEDDGVNAAGDADSGSVAGDRGGMFGGRGGEASSNGTIVISGGNLNITASGDGIDANGTLTISGGYTVVTGPTQGDTATLDYDVSGVITGGTFVGTGASGMAQSFSDSEQGVLAVRLNEQTAKTAITVQDDAGNVLVSHTPSLAFEVIIISTPELVSGETYTVCVGTQTETVTAG